MRPKKVVWGTSTQIPQGAFFVVCPLFVQQPSSTLLSKRVQLIKCDTEREKVIDMIAAYRHTNLEHLLTLYFEYMTDVNEALFAKGVMKKVKVTEESEEKQE